MFDEENQSRKMIDIGHKNLKIIANDGILAVMEESIIL